MVFGFIWAPRMGIGSVGNRLELKEMKKVGSGEFWSGGSAIALLIRLFGMLVVLSIALGR